MKETPIVGVNQKAQKDELISNQEKQAQAKLEIMDALDAIKVPIMCTVIIDPEAFEYRNREFWKAFEQRDKKVREQLTNYLNTKKR